jgi:hypothetical protein
MTATPETTTSADSQHHLLAGLAEQGRYAFQLARAGREEESAEHLKAVEGLITAYRLATGAWDDEAIHRHFGLSYANYLVLPRTLLQSMPDAFQARFVALLNELHEAFQHVPQAEVYDVRAGTENLLRDMTESQLFAAGVEVSGDDELGHGPDTKYHRISDGAELEGNSYGFLPGRDPVPHYNRGRTRIEPRLEGGE